VKSLPQEILTDGGQMDPGYLSMRKA